MIVRTRGKERVNKVGRCALPWLVVFAMSLACSLPFLKQTEPSLLTPMAEGTGILVTAMPTPTPTATPQPLPPTVVESNPPAGAQVALQPSIILYFNQAIERASLEAALSAPPGKVEWLDEATLVFTPTEALAPSSDLVLSLDSNLRAANGLALPEPLQLTYHAIGYLRPVQRLPEPNTVGVNPTSAVVVAFDQPVVPLGAEQASLPAAFTLNPTAQGESKWINTSTYVFYPDPPLAGGVTYTVILNPQLTSSAGSPLESDSRWSFTTESARLFSIEPGDGAKGMRLDQQFTLTFNQPMDAESVAENLELYDAEGYSIPINLSWNEDSTIATLQPKNLLRRDASYTVRLNKSARTKGGSTLNEETEMTFRTVASLQVTGTDPLPGGKTDIHGSIKIHFNAPLGTKDALQFVTFIPEAPNLSGFTGESQYTLYLFADFAADTDYTVVVSPNLPDAWNGRLGEEFVLRFHTLPLEPQFRLLMSDNVLFTTPQDVRLAAHVVNLSEVSLSLAEISLEQFVSFLQPAGYDLMEAYQPEMARSITQRLDVSPNRAELVEVNLTPSGEPLNPGLYFIRFSDYLYDGTLHTSPILLVSSHVHLTFKLSPSEALVWAVDLRNGEPLAGAPVVIYDENGSPRASGTTDKDGVFKGLFQPREDSLYANPYDAFYAVLGKPGEDRFSLALSYWDIGIQGWDFDISTDYSPPRLQAYLYTDRPIYRPGNTVYFRVVARQSYNGRYSLPKQPNLEVKLYGDTGEVLQIFDLKLNAFGTAHASYTLPPDAKPGYYNLTCEEANYSTVSFQVAEYRKPEINLQVDFASEQARAGDALLAKVQGRYYFDAPAGNVAIQWTLYRAPSYFYLPEYQVGVEQPRWFSPYPDFYYDPLGELVTQGEAQTDAAGILNIKIPIESTSVRQKYTLEVTAIDESGQPVSARAVIQVNPAEFYIGVKPDTWVGQAGGEMGFEVRVVDWQGEPDGVRSLRAEFKKVIWERIDPSPSDPYGYPTYVPHETLIGSTDFATAEDGLARLAFIPPEPGTYRLDVFGMPPDEQARTESLLWVGGSGEAIWPSLPNQHLNLSADKESYLPGDTARIFIPNPLQSTTFEGGSLALVTVERSTVLRHQVLSVESTGSTLSLPLSEEDAPNVYVTVTLIGQKADGSPDFRYGILDVPVQPSAQRLNVSLTSQPQRTAPGEPVALHLRVTDAQGKPAVGEFSISVVDMAVLALVDPNSEPIGTAFYGNQPLGVRTSQALAASAQRLLNLRAPLGGGGGGMPAPLVVRERFPDTAYWNAEIVTDANGEAQVTLPLPDSLTTWQVEARGLTGGLEEEMRVGQATMQIVTTKDLLVRPVTPRFVVLGDHVRLAAVVQNNTTQELETEVSLQANGFVLDDPATTTQHVRVSAGGRVHVEWWGQPQDVEKLDLIFMARSGEYQDATRPLFGALPVLRYSAPQSFAASGTLDEEGERLEIISLPRSFDAHGGELSLELAPSLAASMLNALQALENFPYASTEQTLSRFLPNLETYRVLQQFGISAEALKPRLDRTLQEGLTQLVSRQNSDGGWGWWRGGGSDSYVTAYILFGLARAQQAGVAVESGVMQRAIEYLRSSLPAPKMLSETWQLDRLVFTYFALAQAAEPATLDLGTPTALFEMRQQLSPWAQALLALTFDRLSPEDERIATLLSDLQTSAIRAASGAHWEDSQPSWRNMSSPIYASAVVLYALAQHDPASPLVAEAVRYLMAHRQAGGWNSTYETAWTLMALAEVMRGTAELGGDFDFTATLNGSPIVEGKASGTSQLTPVTTTQPIDKLYSEAPNALLIQRTQGSGRLYYTARLRVYQPVEQAAPIQRGFTLQRAYYPADPDCTPSNCQLIHSARAGDLVTVRLTLIVPQTAYYLLVEDYFPAGTEVLDTSLKTSQLGAAADSLRDPFGEGWGWWYFSDPQVYDDHITWAVEILPPGTYEFTYKLVILTPGEYRVLPARVWQFYFPEVQGTSAGEVFAIEP